MNSATEYETGNFGRSRKVASWVIRDKETGQIVMETFERRIVDDLNIRQFEAVPIDQYLASLNRE